MRKKLNAITPNDRAIIDRYFINCEGNNGREICPNCLIRHPKLPKPMVFKQIVDSVENFYSQQAYADYWGSTRQAVGVIFQRAFDNVEWSSLQYNVDLTTEYDKIIRASKDNPHVVGDVSLCRQVGIDTNFLAYVKRRYTNLDELLKEQYDKNKKIPKPEYKCYRCHIVKPRALFHNSKRFADGVSRTCAKCSKAQQKKYYNKRYAENVNSDVFVDSKRCPQCQVTKLAEDFHKSRGNADGLQVQCKSCQADNIRAINLRKSSQMRTRTEQF